MPKLSVMPGVSLPLPGYPQLQCSCSCWIFTRCAVVRHGSSRGALALNPPATEVAGLLHRHGLQAHRGAHAGGVWGVAL